MRARAALLIVAAALLGGCSHRDHANPFDPLNPETGGRPAGFAALADNGLVRLIWQPSDAAGLRGFELARRVRGSGDYVPFPGVIPSDTDGILDFGLANGTTYEYRLSFVFDHGLGPLPAEDHATPGPTRAWAVDIDGGALRRLTADGHHVLSSVPGFATPAELAIDAQSGAVWVSDPRAGTLTAVHEATPATVIVSGLGSPGPIVVDPLDEGVWVSDAGSSSVRHYRPTGDPGSPTSIGPLDTPDGLAIDPLDRSLWICERDANQVRRFDVNGVQLGLAAVRSPSRIAIDSLTRVVWVTSALAGQVVRLTSSLVPVDTLRGFAGPVGVAIDHRRGRSWVADPEAGQVVALDRSGAVQFRVTGLPGARMVAVDLATGEAWAAVSTLRRVVRISPAGAVLESGDGLVNPWSVAIVGGR